jgi:hypothetical protein
MKKAKPQDLLVMLNRARNGAKRHGSHTDVESIEATIAKVRAAAEQDDAAIDALLHESHKHLDRVLLMRLKAMEHVAAEERAAIIDQEIKERADELRRSGIRAPVRQAENEAAKQHGFRSGAALNRWLRRNRWPGHFLSG